MIKDGYDYSLGCVRLVTGWNGLVYECTYDR